MHGRKDDSRSSWRGRIRFPFLAGLLMVDLVAIILLSLFNYRVFYIESQRSYEENFISYERNITRMAFNNIENQFLSYMRIPDFYFAAVPQNEAMLKAQKESIIGDPESIKALTDVLFMIQGNYPYLYSMDIYYEGTGTVVTGFGNVHEADEDKLLEFCPWLGMIDRLDQSCLIPMGVNSYPTQEPVMTYVRRINSGSGSIYAALHINPRVASVFISEDAIHTFLISAPDGRLIYPGRDVDLLSEMPSIANDIEEKMNISGEDRVVFSYAFPETGLRYTYLINYSLFRQLGMEQDRQLLALFVVSIFLNILVLSSLSYFNYCLYKRNIRRFSEDAGIPVSGEGVDASLSSMAAQIMNLHHTAQSAKELRMINIVRGLVLSKDGEKAYPQVYGHFSGWYVRCFIIEAEGREGDLMANMLSEQFKAENEEGSVGVLCTFISPKNTVVLAVVDEEKHLLDEITRKIIVLAGDLYVDEGKLLPLAGNGFHESFLSAQEVARYRFLQQAQVLSYDGLGIDGRKSSGSHSRAVEQLEKDLNSQQAEAFMSHLSPLLEDLRDSGFTIQYCISVLSDIAVATYGYMLRSQLDTWIVFGYDIREYAKQIDSIDSYREWMHQVIDTIYRSIRERDENVDSDIRQQIELIISKEIENDISLSLIADRLGMKPYELSRTFTKIMGKNYIDYIKDRKLLKAIEFLRGGMAVQDIAKRLGYRTPQYFIRIFKENYGTTPYQYRKTVLDAEER